MDTLAPNGVVVTEPPQTEPKIISRNPVTGEVLGEVRITPPEEIPAILARAREGQVAWGSLSLNSRLAVIKRIRDLFFYRQHDLAELLSKELGKVPHEVGFEILEPLVWMDFLIKKSKKILKSRKSFVWIAPYRTLEVYRKPYGAVVLIVPWNFPVVLAMDSILPALLTGNSVIYKPSEHTAMLGEFIAQIMHDAGVPKTVFQIVHGYGETGAALVDARPDKISFTGSVATGKKIAARAAQNLTPVTLELGGKDAAIVLEDADIEFSARAIIWGSMVHAGQLCASVERVYVMRPIADQLVAEMREAIKKHVKAGKPDDPNATYGTMTLDKQLQIVREHIADAEQRGATVYRDKPLEANLINLPYHEPVIVVDAPLDAPIVTEETFGPVLAVVRVDSVDEAIRLANDSEYALTASIWTQDRKRGAELARRLQVGSVTINDHLISSSAPQMPWGGLKATGGGRTRSVEGLLSMTVPLAISNERFRPPIDFFQYPYTSFKLGFMRRLIYFAFGPTWRDKVRAFGLHLPTED